jgi:RsiW-degrading membrane proteinase PrsW (M82 family)
MNFLKLFSDIITFIFVMLIPFIVMVLIYESNRHSIVGFFVVVGGVLVGVIIFFRFINRFIKISKKVENTLKKVGNTLKNRYSKK